ncbi:PhnD/SsuA/transferrin family substrate-binding protein [Rhizobium sp. NFR03]|uniref:phosphate/phosphite/phosphonate ABC transporter substrate-binding protein n=1 Tax=Rhizobium sp. NFR03 TaxID=1566263 RepID=UPI0008D10121|nr:PhnD/SsuA/transferrin family substrate-binding protein [Rhizobium sp. NFR03]SER69976.1 ABC-type phosphate/phosphonate transport system, substrate-binding protein [Rhizobium sp. NFR03]
MSQTSNVASRVASLAMYANPAPVAAATAKLWDYLRDKLRAEGLAEVPQALSTLPYDEAWLRPELLLAQTCGFPFVSRLRGKVRLVATPVYRYPGCDGPDMRSFLIVRSDSAATALIDLRGARAAVNQPDSNSGANLFRAMIAPLAIDGRFFGAFIETGSHVASIDAVREGAADIASIDCITYANILRFDPRRLSGIRVLGETVKGPGLPLITRLSASDEEIALLRRVLDAAATDAALEGVRDHLGLVRFARLQDADYEPLAALADGARALGYPVAGA